MSETTFVIEPPKTPFYKNSRLIKTAAVVTAVTVAVLFVGSKLSQSEDEDSDDN